MGGANQETDQICPVQISQTKQAQGHQRSRGARFNPHKGKQEQYHSHEDTNGRKSEPLRLCKHRSVGQQQQRRSDRENSWYIECLVLSLVPALRDEARTDQEHKHADRHIDQKDRGPAKGLCEHSSQHQTKSSTRCSQRTPDAECSITFFWIGKDGDKQGWYRGNEHASPQSLYWPCTY